MIIRSWLFVPGDSERKLVKARGNGADALILDLEDAVSDEPGSGSTNSCFFSEIQYRSHAPATLGTREPIRP